MGSWLDKAGEVLDPTTGYRAAKDYINNTNASTAPERDAITAESAAAAQAELNQPASDANPEHANQQGEATGVVTGLNFGGNAGKRETDYQMDADPEYRNLSGTGKVFLDSSNKSADLANQANVASIQGHQTVTTEREKVIAEQEARMAKLKNEREGRREDGRKRLADLEKQNSIADAYYKDKANAAEWGSIVSRLFGALYAAGGKPELAVKSAEDAVKQEYQAKEHAYNLSQAGIGRKQTLYGLYKQQYEDDDAAGLAMEIDTRNLAAEKLYTIAEKTKDPAAYKAAEALLEKNKAAIALQQHSFYRANRDYHVDPSIAAKHAVSPYETGTPSPEQDAAKEAGRTQRVATPQSAPSGAAPLGSLSSQPGHQNTNQNIPASVPPAGVAAPFSKTTAGRDNFVETNDREPRTNFVSSGKSPSIPNYQYSQDRERRTDNGERYVTLDEKTAPYGVTSEWKKHPGKVVVPDGYLPTPIDTGRGFFLVPEHRKDVFTVRENQKYLSDKIPIVKEDIATASKLLHAYGAFNVLKTSFKDNDEAKKDAFERGRKEYLRLTQKIRTDMNKIFTTSVKVTDPGVVKEGEMKAIMGNLDDFATRFGTLRQSMNSEEFNKFNSTLDAINQDASTKFNSSLVGLTPARRFTDPEHGGYAYWPLQSAGNYGNVTPDNRVRAQASPLKK